MAKIKNKRSFKFRKVIFVLSLIFILVTIPIIVLLVKDSKPRDDRSHAAEITVSSLNTQIESNLSSGNTVANKFLLTQRKEQMEYLAATNPELFLQYAYSQDYRNRFPDEQKPLIEEQAQVSGTLVEAHKDDFENKKVKKEYFIHKDNDILSLNTVSDLPGEDSQTGRSVAVSGYKLGDVVIARNESVSVTGEAVQAAASGEGKYLVVPINFVDDRTRPFTKTQIENRLFGSDNSGNSYFKQVTNGRYGLEGVVASWQESNIKKSTVCDDPDQLVRYAKNHFVLSNYYGLILVFPRINNCDWAGMGTLGSEFPIVWLSEFSLRTITHEIGHNLSLHHASLLKCDSRGCKSDEYGDYSDTLGIYLGNLNGPHRLGLGIMVADGVKLFKSDNTFTLHKLGGSATPQVLEIEQANSDTNIFVEFRGANSKYGNYSPYDLDKGVLIYRWNGRKSAYTYLMDITAGDGKPYNLVLRDGWTTSIGPVKIKQISHTDKTATIKVTKR